MLRGRSAIWLVNASLVAALLWARPSRADQLDVLHAKILLRAMAYDQSLAGRVHGTVVLAVLADETNPASVIEKDRMVAAFSTLSKATIQNLPMRVIALSYADEKGLKAALAQHSVTILFLPSVLSEPVGTICGVAAKARVATLSVGTENAERGVAVSVSSDGGKPILIVNAAASREIGMELRAELLRVAKVIE